MAQVGYWFDMSQSAGGAQSSVKLGYITYFVSYLRTYICGEWVMDGYLISGGRFSGQRRAATQPEPKPRSTIN